MRVGIRASLAAGKIYTVLLLAVVPFALVIPGSEVASSQSSTGAAAQAPLYTAIDLHPSGFASSLAFGVSSGQQVGVGSTSSPNPEGDNSHALVWRGNSAASVVDSPANHWIRTTATCRGQQVGYGSGQMGNEEDMQCCGKAAQRVRWTFTPAALTYRKLPAPPAAIKWDLASRPRGGPMRCCGAVAPIAWWTSTPPGLSIQKLTAPTARSRWELVLVLLQITARSCGMAAPAAW